MKAGLEQRGKLIAAIVLGIVAFSALWFALTRRPDVAAGATVTPTRPTAAPRTATQRKLRQQDRRVSTERSLDPTLRFDLLKASESKEYKGSKRNIFSLESEPVIVAVKKTQGPVCPNDADPRCPPVPPTCPGPDPRCPPPPIPLQFFGFASKPGEPKRIFLRTTDTNDVFVASEGEVVNRRYRVLRIMNSGVEVEDVLNNNKQILPLTQG